MKSSQISLFTKLGIVIHIGPFYGNAHEVHFLLSALSQKSREFMKKHFEAIGMNLHKSIYYVINYEDELNCKEKLTLKTKLGKIHLRLRNHFDYNYCFKMIELYPEMQIEKVTIYANYNQSNNINRLYEVLKDNKVISQEMDETYEKILTTFSAGYTHCQPDFDCISNIGFWGKHGFGKFGNIAKSIYHANFDGNKGKKLISMTIPIYKIEVYREVLEFIASEISIRDDSTLLKVKQIKIVPYLDANYLQYFENCDNMLPNVEKYSFDIRSLYFHTKENLIIFGKLFKRGAKNHERIYIFPKLYFETRDHFKPHFKIFGDMKGKFGIKLSTDDKIFVLSADKIQINANDSSHLLIGDHLVIININMVEAINAQIINENFGIDIDSNELQDTDIDSNGLQDIIIIIHRSYLTEMVFNIPSNSMPVLTEKTCFNLNISTSDILNENLNKEIAFIKAHNSAINITFSNEKSVKYYSPINFTKPLCQKAMQQLSPLLTHSILCLSISSNKKGINELLPSLLPFLTPKTKIHLKYKGGPIKVLPELLKKGYTVKGSLSTRTKYLEKLKTLYSNLTLRELRLKY